MSTHKSVAKAIYAYAKYYWSLKLFSYWSDVAVDNPEDFQAGNTWRLGTTSNIYGRRKPTY
jgi:hypothetical protein